MGAGA
jgi:hypothetical protein